MCDELLLLARGVCQCGLRGVCFQKAVCDEAAGKAAELSGGLVHIRFLRRLNYIV